MHPSTPVAIMTTQFIEYPATDDSAPRVLATNGVSYMIEYRSVLMPYFMREVDVIHPLAEQHGTAIARTVQPLTDIGRAYSVPKTHALESDTLTVYRLHW